MSIASVTRRHTVTVMNRTDAVGAEMGRDRTFSTSGASRQITCTVVPGGSSQLQLMMEKGIIQFYSIYFAADPELDERDRVIWDQTDTIIRIRDVSDKHGQGRLWVADAYALTADNPDNPV